MRQSSTRPPASAWRDFAGMRTGPHQEPAAGRRRERHRDLQFRVIAAAGMRIGLRPAVVEHVFAARVALEVAGRGGNERAVGASDQQMLDLPAGTAADRFRGFQRREKMRAIGKGYATVS